MRTVCRVILWLSLPMILVATYLLAIDHAWGSTLLLWGMVALSIGLGANPWMAPFRFTAWMITSIVLALFYPQSLLDFRPFGYSVDLQNKWFKLIMVQGVMFGMGTQMRLADVVGVVRRPTRVLVGLVCQFTIMPLVGWTLAVSLGLPDEVAAGVVLIGCCSSGLASNVMVHMARGDLALSVTLTSVATILAPLVTPAWMKLLAGQFIEVSFYDMMMNIIKIMVVPIAAAMMHDVLLASSHQVRRIIYALAVVGSGWCLAMAFGGWNWLEQHMALDTAMLSVVALLNYLAGAIAVGVIYHFIVQHLESIQKWMPLLSMVGILYFTAISVASGRDHLLALRWLLLVAAVLHNTFGYLLGYSLSRAVGVDVEGARTIALEVGMQNGAMGVTLADAMGKIATVGLAPTLFSPWMNVSGSLLANFWRRHPVDEPPKGPSSSKDERI